jgi:hypothetical protein
MNYSVIFSEANKLVLIRVQYQGYSKFRIHRDAAL